MGKIYLLLPESLSEWPTISAVHLGKLLLLSLFPFFLMHLQSNTKLSELSLVRKPHRRKTVCSKNSSLGQRGCKIMCYLKGKLQGWGATSPEDLAYRHSSSVWSWCIHLREIPVPAESFFWFKWHRVMKRIEHLIWKNTEQGTQTGSLTFGPCQKQQHSAKGCVPSHQFH